ncbi:unnamed protein product [Prorocentrum cordatum]|uniref:Uncharacterized protein n=1 Tax=Prorocentrum cordatum TaxID=2364126 RepID=A0ABN9YG39_9DINO|nr:unnamed protein product [Polarella glacialis]
MVISGRCRGEEETAWVMQSLMHDQLNRKVDSFSKTTLQTRQGPISVSILRKKLLDGLVAEFLAPAKVTTQEALTAKPGLADLQTALRELERKYSTVDAYQRAKAEDTPISGLPAWATVHFNRLGRQILDGQKDKILAGLCLKPPAGGVGSMTYSSHLRSAEGFATQIEALETQYKEWVANVKGGNAKQEEPPKQNDVAPPGAEGKDSLTESEMRLAGLRGEMSSAATEIRVAYAPIAAIGESALATEKAWWDDNCISTPTLAGGTGWPDLVSVCTCRPYKAITASWVYKESMAGSSSRMCYMYAIPTSWEVKGKPRATPLLPEDFDKFADVVNRLITVENEGYAVVLLGKATKAGWGIGWETGIALQSQIIEAMRVKSRSSFRAKHFTLNFVRPSKRATYARGVAGTLSENAFFFYKGSWPSKLLPKARAVFGGATWDDRWEDVPLCPDLSHCAVPAAVRDMIFEDIWSARGAPEEDQGDDEEKTGAGQATAAEEGGVAEATPTKTAGKKDKKDKSKKTAKESAKKGKKDKPKESEKKGGKKDKPGKAGKTGPLKESRLLITAPACLAADVPQADPKTDAPLFSNEYHADVYSQVDSLFDLDPSVDATCVWAEWEAKRAVLFTPGNGIAALAAVQREFPLLLLGLSAEHVQLLEYFVDCGIAMAMQVSGNRLHDKDAMEKVERALGGHDSDDDAPEATPPKKKKHKKEDKTSSSGETSTSNDGTDENDSAEE